jgi:hypothetical protein
VPLRAAGGRKPFRLVSGTFQSGRRGALHRHVMAVAFDAFVRVPQAQAVAPRAPETVVQDTTTASWLRLR